MAEPFQIRGERIAGPEAANELMSKIFQVTQPEAVYAVPVTQGEYTVITASEVSVGLGFGYGAGSSSSRERGQQASETDESGAPSGFGGGGGGGGGAMARPVAVIEIGPHGVRVEPVVDPTKIVLAFVTALGAMVAALAKMRRMARG